MSPVVLLISQPSQPAITAIRAIYYIDNLQRARDWRGGGGQISPPGEEQSEAGGRDTALSHPVSLRGEAGRPLRVKPELCAGHRVLGWGGPRHQVRTVKIFSSKQQSSVIITSQRKILLLEPRPTVVSNSRYHDPPGPM